MMKIVFKKLTHTYCNTRHYIRIKYLDQLQMCILEIKDFNILSIRIIFELPEYLWI